MYTESEPTRIEIEKAFYAILENGDEAAIARAIEHTAGYVSQLYSPDNERQSTLFRAIKELRAWRRESPERGSRALELLVHFVETGLGERPLNVVDETRKLKQQVDEWENVEMEAAPLESRISEIRDIKLQAKRTLKAHDQNLRSLAKTAVETRRNGHR